jgi:hypothetical protein
MSDPTNLAEAANLRVRAIQAAKNRAAGEIKTVCGKWRERLAERLTGPEIGYIDQCLAGFIQASADGRRSTGPIKVHESLGNSRERDLALPVVEKAAAALKSEGIEASVSVGCGFETRGLTLGELEDGCESGCTTYNIHVILSW